MGIQFIVGDGFSINAWSDCWIPKTPIPLELLPKPPDTYVTHVYELIDPVTRKWKTELVCSLWPQIYPAQILSIPLSINSHEDYMVWSTHKSGNYTVKSAYYKMLESIDSDLTVSSHPFKLIWRLNIPIKVRFLCWQLVQKVIPSAEFLISRGMTVNGTCSFCKLHVAALHLFFKCDFARAIWFELNLSNLISRVDHTDIKDGFCTIINELYSVFSSMNSLSKGKAHYKDISITWSKPQEHWLKLNTDGSTLGNDKHGGAGTNALLAEFWALRLGLAVIVSLGMNNIQIEMGSTFLYDTISGGTPQKNFKVQELAADIKYLLEKIPNHKLQWKYREGNRLADAFARHATRQAQEIYEGKPCDIHRTAQPGGFIDIIQVFSSFWWLQPPSFVSNELMWDVEGLGTTRKVPS
ncbi:hypothetical protein AQUCO_01800135v1 [Aquilegia coerulea]|uniref:Uncharacterized protein n=1 Tax=Aquilegia coerulea TaxID=218851 RepID=A0A2G5DK38_AQUCA|nr:hypothetical protein AQUCO_01800135v1 [Aquilegia coerulea]